MLCYFFMVDLVNTMAMNSKTRISAEPASPSRWLVTTDGTRPAFPALMGSMSAVDARPSVVAREKGVTNQ